MKMILFRPTLVCGMLALSSLLSSPVSAMPQFGRPLFWALDGVPTSDSGSGNGAQSGPAGFVNPNPVKNATNTSVLAQDNSGNSTSGALHHLGGGVHLPVVLVVSAAASAAFLAF